MAYEEWQFQFLELGNYSGPHQTLPRTVIEIISPSDVNVQGIAARIVRHAQPGLDEVERKALANWAWDDTEDAFGRSSFDYTDRHWIHELVRRLLVATGEV